ncbi:lectin family integral membrane [Phlyctema vagabunda]|uniref:Lectin family integral membrane n=1 Tax=Phlyctema vagabunda TaxID=108571 RepID=A0ABR4P763_9HELO
MVYLKAPLSSLASAALVAIAQASYLASDLSFGHNGKISPNLRAIPHFHLIGEPNAPEILSNKVILTPPAPGNQRGAVWSDLPLQNKDWVVDIDFRATGQERGGGNFQIWYVKDGQKAVGTSSIYTAGKFDGLALVIDQYAGSGGYVRGFLNDGNAEYKSHHSVDSLAFGHCEYSYRNLGRPSRIHIRHVGNIFRVEIDGKTCFESSKIKLPLGYHFGVSAASAENPDSFEIYEFVTTTEEHTPEHHDVEVPGHLSDDESKSHESLPSHQETHGSNQEAVNQGHQGGDLPSFSDPPEVPASAISTDAQFADLHNRLQAMMKHITFLSRDLLNYQETQNKKSAELSNQLTQLSSSLNRLDGLQGNLQGIEKKIEYISSDVKQTKSDLHNALDQHVAGLKTAVGTHHENLMANVVASAPSIVAYTIVVLGSQGVLIVAYLLYKRRKANGPKKYL